LLAILDAKMFAYSALATTRDIIGELDAMGGSNEFHYPPQ